LGLLAIPLLLQQLVSMGVIEGFRFMFTDFLPLPAYRAGEISLKNIPHNLLNIFKLLLGGDPLSFNCFKEFGPVYRCMVPLIITGIISVIVQAKNKTERSLQLCIVSLYGLSVYIISLLLAGYNTYNSNSIYIVFAVLAIEGIVFLAGSLCSSATDTVTDRNPAEDTNIGKMHRFPVRQATPAIVLGILFISFLLYSEFYFRRQGNVYGMHPVFMSTEPGDIVKYAMNTYNKENDKDIYIEVNYSERDYADLCIALFTETDPALWRRYEDEKQSGNADPVLDRIHMKFPEEYDENEDAVYILGADWGHIAAYLIDTGWSSDTSFPGYTILYRP
nr:hypothetical protein [Lachnospiraceae bacterium]